MKLLSTDANPAAKWFLNVHIARSDAFLLWICGGFSCTTDIIFFCFRFNAVDASLSIMLNVGACPAFLNCRIRYHIHAICLYYFLFLWVPPIFNLCHTHTVLTCNLSSY